MTSTTSETSTLKAGSVVTARTSDTNTVVWFYVIAPLADGKVFGVNCGSNAARLTPEGSGFRFDTATVEHYGDPLTLARFDAPVLEALTSFLANAGLPAPGTGAPATPDTSEAVRQAVAEVEQRHQRWIDSLVSDAHEFADENSLCSEFDRFMREHNLPERVREREIEYRLTVTYTGTATVQASDDDDAWDLFYSDPWAYVSQSDVAAYGDVEVTPSDY